MTSPDSLPAVRIFLPTYRRPKLLQRAIRSLCAQTAQNWVCELHNDDPSDNGPAELLKSLGDPRIQLQTHARNLGPTATFNLIYQNSAAEPFYTILEDDNWWEPEFLETMLRAALDHPQVTVVWSNMRVWQELASGEFRDTGELLNHYSEGDPPRLVRWGHPMQLHGALHSHGAILIRSHSGRNFGTPNIPIAMVEMVRERMFPFPLLFVPRPVANFARTLQTARSKRRETWTILQCMLTGTFVKHARYSEAQIAGLWKDARASRPPTTTTLLMASFLEPSCRKLRREAGWRDWLLLLRGMLFRPSIFLRVLLSRRLHRDWWNFLDKHTAARFAEAEKQKKTEGRKGREEM